MEEKAKKLLGELLIEDGALTRETLSEALQYQKSNGGLIGQILVSLGYVTEENLVVALSRQLAIPYIGIQNYSIDDEVSFHLSEDFCRKNLILGFDWDEKRIFIAMADPSNEGLTQEIEKRSGRKAQVFISTPTEIINSLDVIFASNKKGQFKKAG